jgi:hypothetical protein
VKRLAVAAILRALRRDVLSSSIIWIRNSALLERKADHRGADVNFVTGLKQRASGTSMNRIAEAISYNP